MINEFIPRITLFDLDGVLIQPGGYRAAVKETVNYFSHKLGLGNQIPKEEDIAFFEANGITSEWDMVPICTAILIDLACKAIGADFPDGSLDDLAKYFGEKGIRIEADFQPEIEKLVPFMKKAGLPAAESLYAAVQGGKVFEGWHNKQIMKELLKDTRHVAKSETLRVFQNFILGNAGFVQAYGLQPVFNCNSYLKMYDRPLLKPENQKRLLRLITEGLNPTAIITARPSLAPAGISDESNDYSPEAEMAIRLAGIDGIPAVGFGTIQFLAGKMGVLPDSLVKPSPVQALAAIAAACGVDLQKALDWAFSKVFLDGKLFDEKEIPPRFVLHIFEDSAIGILACQSAAAILARGGVELTLKAWGIARNPDKIVALETVGASVFPDINQAIEEALEINNRP